MVCGLWFAFDSCTEGKRYVLMGFYPPIHLVDRLHAVIVRLSSIRSKVQIKYFTLTAASIVGKGFFTVSWNVQSRDADAFTIQR